MKRSNLFVILLCCVVSSKCAKILGIFYVPSISHQLVYHPIYKELSLRGHEVTVVTPNPLNDPKLTNLTEIDLSHIYKHRISDYEAYEVTFKKFLTNIYKFVFDSTESLLKDVKVQELCNSEEFDLVLIEGGVPLYHAFGFKCNAPVITVWSMDGSLSSHSNEGNPIHPYLFADMMMSFAEPLSLWKKLEHSYNFIWYKLFYKFTVVETSDALVKQYLGKDYPSVEELERNCSMLFVNNNLLLSPIRPLTPSTVSMGFMHIKPNNPLPEDMQTILDNATQGAVYFSLGSNVRSSELPAPTVKLIKDALSEVPYTVLWKWESDDVPGVGPNVVTRKWFPQQDILAHKNLRGFVTQGGLQSTEEAIHYGVPMVGIPFLGDQEMNVKQSMKLGISLYLDHRTMTKDELKKNIIEIMEDPKYLKRIQELKEIAQDQPMTGLERAVWWSEYVIRHKGAKHLRSPAADMPVWEYLMLDVIAVVLVALIITLVVLYKVIKFLFGLVFKNSQKIKTS